MLWFVLIIGFLCFFVFAGQNTEKQYSTTDYDLAEKYFSAYPKVHYELQELVMQMEKIYGSGLRNFPSHKEIEKMSGDTKDEMLELESIIRRLTVATAEEHNIGKAVGNEQQIRKTIWSDLRKFQECYPNWQGAYTFGKRTFFEIPKNVEDFIGVCLWMYGR